MSKTMGDAPSLPQFFGQTAVAFAAISRAPEPVRAQLLDIAFRGMLTAAIVSVHRVWPAPVVVKR